MENNEKKQQTLVIIDFGGQYVKLVSRCLMECCIKHIVVPPTIKFSELHQFNVLGFILSGGPDSIYDTGAPKCTSEILYGGVPILGICYGMQLIADEFGGRVGKASKSEYGPVKLSTFPDSELFSGIENGQVWMSHSDTVIQMPRGFDPSASTNNTRIAAFECVGEHIYGVQFHPEVKETEMGVDLLERFATNICGYNDFHDASDNIPVMVESLCARIGDEHVICALSGGVDSTALAFLLNRAIGNHLHCVLVNNGLMRQDEVYQVASILNPHFDNKIHIVDDQAEFLKRLAGVTDPALKRTIIGKRFIEVFREVADDIGVQFLAQGTLYPDVVESGQGMTGNAAKIKLHHNVGGLPADHGFKLIEPFRDLFKDQVREIAEVLGVPGCIIQRHPFPGPGLAVRILGEVTFDRLEILRKADQIMQQELITSHWYDRTAQACCVLIPHRTVGVKGDALSYESQYIIAIRCVDTSDFMTADWTRIDFDVLATISTRIMNEVSGVNRVVYDISTKPPATIEWE